MRAIIKDLGFALFFLIVIAVVAVEAAESEASGDRYTRIADEPDEKKDRQ
ncbi:MAG: hypothetical protein KY410_07245 [Proteobacteria bacterium]|nr:hypothetical protein [Pseudomonadota bacterium]